MQHTQDSATRAAEARAGRAGRPDFREARRGSLWLAHRPDLDSDAVVAAIDVHRRNHARGRAACEKWGSRSSVSRVTLGGTDVAVKWIRWRGLRSSLSESVLGSRAARARSGAARIAALGIRTPEPLAIAERRRWGLVVESFLVTRFVHAEPLPALLPLAHDRVRRRALAAALGDLLGTLHASGVDHRDLKPSNLLAADDGSLWLLDLDALARRSRLGWSARVRALGRLEAYARDLAPALPRSDRARFLRAYVSRDPSVLERRHALAGQADALAQRRAEAWASRPRPGRGHFPMAPRRDPTSAPLRIALVHTRASDTGGVERQIQALAARLLASGCEVHFFFRRADPGLDARAQPGIQMHRIPDPARPLPFLRVWLFDRMSRAAVDRAGPFDLVCGFGKTSRQDVYRDGSGCLADFQTWSIDSRGGSWRGRLRRASPHQRVVAAIERRRYAGPEAARFVFAISGLVRSQILRRHGLPPERVEVLHPGVDLERFHPARRDQARVALCAELGVPARAPLLVFVGSDFERKGLRSLIEALPSLPDAQVLVLGSDRRRRVARERRAARVLGVDRRVHFLGLRPDPERWLAASDCLVHPTRFDAFGNAVLEAMASGIPVVVSRFAGASELVLDGKTGRVLDAPDDPVALAEAVRPFLEPGLRREAGALARKASEQHSWDRHFERVLEVYRKLASSTAS